MFLLSTESVALKTDGFESEPVGLDLDSLQHFFSEHLVARLHVRQFQICESVRKQRQQAEEQAGPVLWGRRGLHLGQ
jgi:hypothetical protein